MNNPFIFGSVVGDRHFIDREDAVSDIAGALKSGQNIICYSPRRYGKTSMMMRVKEVLEKEGRLVFFIDMFRITSVEDVYTAFASSILAACKTPLQAAIELIARILPTINPRIVFQGQGTPTVEMSANLPLLLKSSSLRELFDALELFCAKKRKKGTVIIDEFQEIMTIKEGAVIEREMRSAFQHHKHVSYAFLGSQQHLLKNMFKDKNRPLYNFGRHVEIDVIPAQYWKEHISSHMKHRCTAPAIDAVLSYTANHPYYTQMVCHYLFEVTGKKGVVADEKVVEQVVDDIVRRDSMLFMEIWGGLNTRERHLCKAIAGDAPKSPYESQFMLKHQLGSASSVQKTIDGLFRHDVIRKNSEGNITMVNPLFRYWILNAGSCPIPNT